MKNLYLDDVRPTPEGFNLRAFTAAGAIRLLEGNIVDFLSYGHDLGEEVNGTGYDVAKYIEEMAYYGMIPRLKWTIHSANPVGRKNIEQAMMNAERYWRNHEM